jgi:hypothetical protein
MLINCPRCGFSQPQDQYCASCGVNIETYVPRKESPWKKIFSNTLSQVAIVIAVALGASYYTLRAQDSSSQQSSRRKNIQQTTSNTSLSTSQPAARPETASPGEVSGNENPSADVSVELQNEEQRNRLAGAANEPTDRAANPNLKTMAASATLPTTTAAAMAAAAPSVNIKISYYEVSRTILSYWIQNSRAPIDVEAAFNTGVINRKLFDDQVRYTALKSESTKTVLNAKANFKSDANKDGIMIGLESEISMNSLNSGSISITKTTSQGTDNIRTFINLPSDSIFFLHWKNDLIGLQNEAALAEVPPFQILKSRQYLEQKTELVMIIESLN